MVIKKYLIIFLVGCGLISADADSMNAPYPLFPIDQQAAYRTVGWEIAQLPAEIYEALRTIDKDTSYDAVVAYAMQVKGTKQSYYLNQVMNHFLHEQGYLELFSAFFVPIVLAELMTLVRYHTQIRSVIRNSFPINIMLAITMSYPLYWLYAFHKMGIKEVSNAVAYYDTPLPLCAQRYVKIGMLLKSAS